MDFTTVTAPRKDASLVSVDGRSYPLRAAILRARASGGVAATTLIQEFSNPHDEALEVLYTLPLPADGAVLGYTIHVGERVIRGEIEPRDTAEKKYREALYEGKTAGLLEEERADTFTQRLGNIPPRTDVRVEIETLQRLAFVPASGDDLARWEYRFPTVATVRYHGPEGRVPDAERISPDRSDTGDIPTRVQLALTIDDESAAAGAVDSPSHQVITDRTSGPIRVRLAEGSPLDRDLVVRWLACTPEVGVHLTEGPGLPGDDGRYALLTITPPAVPAAAFRRDLTVLLDTSGSMDGAPLEAAKRVVARLLESLAPEDRFEVIEFSDKPRRLVRDLVRADAGNVQGCLAKLMALRADGSTEMIDAFLEALKPKDLDAQRQVVLVSDGQIAFENEVLREILDAGSVVTRVHVAGIGAAPNRALTESVARAGRGVEVLVGDEAAAEGAARRLIEATALPVLVDVRVAGKGVKQIAPARPADVFAGQPLALAIELGPRREILEVSGRLAGSDARWAYHVEAGGAAVEVEGATADTIPIGALFGKERIRDLELEEAAHPYGNDADIEATAMRHRIVSRRTSLVAVAEEPSVDPRAPRRRERLALEVPWGMSAEGLGLDRTMALPHDALHMWQRHLLSPGVAPRAAGLSSEMIASAVDRIRDKTAKRPGDGPYGTIKGHYTGGTHPEFRLRGTIVRQDLDRAVIEFEVPFDGFTILASGWSGAGAAQLVLVEDESSQRGPHVAGTLIRVALRTSDGSLLEPMSIVSFEERQGSDSLRIQIFLDRNVWNETAAFIRRSGL